MGKRQRIPGSFADRTKNGKNGSFVKIRKPLGAVRLATNRHWIKGGYRVQKTKNKWDLVNHEVGFIAHNWVEDGIRCLVLRGPAHWCGYVGVPKDHPAAGFDYDDLTVSCHGGPTYAGGGLKGAPEGYYWYGWDYGHSGDASYYGEKY